MSRVSKRLMVMLGLALCLTALPLVACPNCREAHPINARGEVDPTLGDYSTGINNSIYFMLVTIYSVGGAFGFFIYRATRIQRLEDDPTEVDAAVDLAWTPGKEPSR